MCITYTYRHRQNGNAIIFFVYNAQRRRTGHVVEIECLYNSRAWLTQSVDIITLVFVHSYTLCNESCIRTALQSRRYCVHSVYNLWYRSHTAIAVDAVPPRSTARRMSALKAGGGHTPPQRSVRTLVCTHCARSRFFLRHAADTRGSTYKRWMFAVFQQQSV